MKRTVAVNGRQGVLQWAVEDGGIVYTLETGEETVRGSVSVTPAGPGLYSVLSGTRSLVFRPGRGSVRVEGFDIEVTITDPREWNPAGPGAAGSGRMEIAAPMPGKVIRVLVGEGEEVQAGQGIVVVEAMKMQNEMRAPRAGRIAGIRVTEGAAVGGGEVLAVIE